MLLSNLDLLATAPGGVARLRELILTLAVQGNLVPQDSTDEPASVLLQKIRAEKDRLIARGKIRRDKQLAAIADEEKPFELPVGWEWVALGEVGLVGSSSRVHQSDWKSDGVPFYRAREIVKLSRDGHVQNDLFISEELFESLARGGSVPEENDIMVTGVGTIGVPYVVQPGDRFYFKDASVLIFKNYGRLDSQYLRLFMQSPLWIDGIHEHSMGTTVDTLTIARANVTLLPLPPLAEQSRIVTRIEELMRLCDALESKGELEATQHGQLVSTLLGTLTASTTPEELAENWQRVAQHFDLLLDRPEAIDALEQTLLQLAVRGLLVPQDHTDEPASALLQRLRAEKDRLIATGQIKRDKPLSPITDEEKPFGLPVGWEYVRFGNASINRDGERIPVSSSDRESRAKTYDYYGASGVIDKIDGFLFDKTLLLIGEDGANLINRSTPIAFLAHGKYWVNNHAHVIDTTHPELMTYLALFINAISLEPYVTGTAQPKMNQAKLNSIVIALPPLAEQSRIVTRVTALRRLCADLRKRLAERQSVQARLADALVGAASFSQ